MSVTATVEVTLTATPWQGYPAEENGQGTSDTVPDAHVASEQMVDNPSPEEKLAAKLASARPRRRTSREVTALVAAATTLVVLVVTLWNSFFLVNNGEVAIVSFGGNVESAYDSGAHLKAPWQSVDRLPTSFQSSTWSYAPDFNNGDNGSLLTTTRDSVWVYVDMQAAYRQQNLDQIVANWRNYGSQDALRAQVDTTIEHATQSALRGFTTTEIWQRDAHIEQAVQTEVSASLKTRFGIDLRYVIIKNYVFNEEITRALNTQGQVLAANK